MNSDLPGDFVFSCHNQLLLDSKCEWRFLESFVRQLNAEAGTDYERLVCPDVADSTRPQPEVLLRDGITAEEMVIERKSIVWPSDYIAEHKQWHARAEEALAVSGAQVYEETISEETEPEDILRARNEALAGFSAELHRTLAGAASKFGCYASARRVVVLQFVGRGTWVLSSDIEGMFRSVALPDEIDQVWAAYHQWTGADDYEVAWYRFV